jgi:hypothetical protein
MYHYCPMFMWWFVWCGLFEWKQICTCFLLFVYTVKPVYKEHSYSQNLYIKSTRENLKMCLLWVVPFIYRLHVQKFTKAFLDISELCIPKREVTIRCNDKLWFVSILRKEIRKRDRLWEIISLTWEWFV